MKRYCFLGCLALIFAIASCKHKTAEQAEAGKPGSELESAIVESPHAPARVALGQRLFFDPILSRDTSISCASCHIPAFAFSDTLPLSKGVGGKQTLRNSPSLVNIGFHPYLMREGGNPTLEVQVFVPLEGEDEMHLPMTEAIQRLKQDKSYVADFKSAYGKGPTAFGITRALAAYERTILGGPSRFDLFLDGDLNALSAEEQLGYKLFTSDALQCSSCHSGRMLSNFAFENNGTKEQYKDRGRARLTLKDEDEGKFKVPSLRNVSLTAPYMFDGTMVSLEEVIDHYASGGSGHPNKSGKMTGFKLSKEEKKALVAFLSALEEEAIYLP